MVQPSHLTQLDQLAEPARRLLPALLDDDSGLFANKAVLTPGGVQRMGTNAVYSAMTVIGILNDDTGGQADADADALALVLSALAATMDAFPGKRQGCLQRAAPAADELLDRFSDSAQLFRGRSRALRPSRQFDWLMTSFASQVYPIHGLAQFARASETELPGQAERAADRLVELQGPLGQWWWIYSTRNGTVLDGYPVYSVHQDAMAFMALASVQNLGVRSYDEELALGVRWMFGQNELGVPLVDLDRSFFSRCIQRRGADADASLGMSWNQRRQVVLSSFSLQAPADPAPDPEGLEILEETRPYHLGWLLYARSLVKDW
jgi:hypothetical protein